MIWQLAIFCWRKDNEDDSENVTVMMRLTSKGENSLNACEWAKKLANVLALDVSQQNVEFRLVNDTNEKINARYVNFVDVCNCVGNVLIYISYLWNCCYVVFWSSLIRI